MKKSIVFLLHAGFWTCYLSLLMFMVLATRFGASGGPNTTYIIKLLMGMAIIPAIISFYSFYSALFFKFLKQKNILALVGSALLIALTSSLIGGAVLSLTFGSGFMFKDGFNSFIGIIIFIFFLALITGTIGLVIKGFIGWYGDIKLKENLTKKNHEMELALVKAQIDPHFLFNTLNNIDVLIQKDATKASEYLNKLSEIMRFMLFETKTDKIQITQELEYLEKYISLQKIRTSNPNFVNMKVIGNQNNITVAPMLFIPFIENAFKHSVNKKIENAIDINLEIKQDKITFNCENKFNEKSPLANDHNGLGNELIQKRLNLLYPNNHKLNVTKFDGVYKVTLVLKRNEY